MFWKRTTKYSLAAPLIVLVVLSGSTACARPEPTEAPHVAKLVFGPDMRGVEETPEVSLEGEYSLDTDCTDRADVVIAILVDREEVLRLPIQCTGVTSTQVTFEKPVAAGLVSLNVVSGLGEGTATLRVT
ncbi:hypothetical protein [Tessaracoccus antarcticus]|uniref:Lipoprotein n=1 Tax=Tessaracoccus antarcticus TaxID=2479848 RepID=A0A3M0G8R3_9ACTN|nr:hypothetical protein [Tessaracoccus antarcticus]RMB61304.1 hypothetical protein EAX62_01150 [Tessaracoccus antarcticus]